MGYRKSDRLIWSTVSFEWASNGSSVFHLEIPFDFPLFLPFRSKAFRQIVFDLALWYFVLLLLLIFGQFIFSIDLFLDWWKKCRFPRPEDSRTANGMPPNGSRGFSHPPIAKTRFSREWKGRTINPSLWLVVILVSMYGGGKHKTFERERVVDRLRDWNLDFSQKM